MTSRCTSRRVALRRTVAIVAVVATLAGCTVAQTAAVYHEPESSVTRDQQIAAWVAFDTWVKITRENDPRLVCIRSHESANLPNPWAAYNPTGPYYGAYQYLQSTWNNHAALAGRPDLIGLPPIEPAVSRWDQDAVTLNYLAVTGDWSPWGGPCS